MRPIAQMPTTQASRMAIGSARGDSHNRPTPSTSAASEPAVPGATGNSPTPKPEAISRGKFKVGLCPNPPGPSPGPYPLRSRGLAPGGSGQSPAYLTLQRSFRVFVVSDLIQPVGHVVRPAVAEVQVVAVLPHIEAKQHLALAG